MRERPTYISARSEEYNRYKSAGTSARSRSTDRGPRLHHENRRRHPAMTKRSDDKPKLLSGGNPQIPKADGDEPVQAYIAAMPGWKHDVGRKLDALIERTVPGVRKAVRWNSP